MYPELGGCVLMDVIQCYDLERSMTGGDENERERTGKRRGEEEGGDVL